MSALNVVFCNHRDLIVSIKRLNLESNFTERVGVKPALFFYSLINALWHEFKAVHTLLRRATMPNSNSLEQRSTKNLTNDVASIYDGVCNDNVGTQNGFNLFEELSNDQSATAIGGARGPVKGTVPSFGPITFSRAYTTTTEFNDISIRMARNPFALTVRAVRADGKGNVSSFARRIPKNFRGVITVAANVRNGVRFKLKFDAPTRASFGIDGSITY